MKSPITAVKANVIKEAPVGFVSFLGATMGTSTIAYYATNMDNGLVRKSALAVTAR